MIPNCVVEKSLSDPAVILCVDDELAALQLRAVILSLAGYESLTAASAEDALNTLRFRRVDLVIVDQMLPGLSGTEVIGKIKKLRPELPVVLLSGLVEPPEGAEQADLFITKGLPPQQFLEQIGELLKHRRSCPPDRLRPF